MNIEEIYHVYLKAEESKKDRDSNVFHASGAGGCYRKQIYSFWDYPSDEKDMKSYRLLRLGTIVHKEFEKALSMYSDKLDEMQRDDDPIQRTIHSEEKINIPKFNVVGTFDAGERIEDGTSIEFNLYDFKTVAAYSWQGMFGRKQNRRPMSPNYKLQLGTYALGIHEKYEPHKINMFLLYYNKNTSLMREVRIDNEWIQNALEYWIELNEILNEWGSDCNQEKFFEEEFIPQVSHGVPFQDWECSYCQYASICPSKLSKKR